MESLKKPWDFVIYIHKIKYINIYKKLLMNDLISALLIFNKYCDNPYPTSCEHDELYVHVSPSKVSGEDTVELYNLGFTINSELDCFVSYRFGSC